MIYNQKIMLQSNRFRLFNNTQRNRGVFKGRMVERTLTSSPKLFNYRL